MAVSTSILGINARNYLYIRKFNRRKHKLVADDKLATKERMLKHDVPTTKLLAKFESHAAARSFDWKTLPPDFVLKPARGYGGKGIIVVGEWDGEMGVTPGEHRISRHDLEAEIFGILDGAHSLKNLADEAFIEERVQPSTFFKKLSPDGIPDIRVIVWKKVPVMAMLRVPTIYSAGKANLHSGAVGLGIDLRTGITTYGVSGGKMVTSIPGKKQKVRGIKLPDWNKIMRVATEAQVASKLGFAGIDIVLDQEQGPLVLEVNARPGLSIQVANQDSLRTRLERVSHMEVESVERGVELAQTLFAEQTLSDVEHEDNILGVIEKVTIYGTSKKKTVRAKIDTGAYRTSLDSDLVHELGLDKHHKKISVRAGSGRQQRHTVKVKFKLKGKMVDTVATYTERSHMRFPMIVGRKDIKNYLVDPAKIPEGVKVK